MNNGAIDNNPAPSASKKRDLLCIAALFLVSAIFFYPFWARGRVFLPADFLYNQLPWASMNTGFAEARNPEPSDAVQQHYPWRVFYQQSIRDGIVPLWNPHQFCGQPFAANDQSAVFYPLNLVFYLAFDAATAYTLGAWLHLWLGGLFMFLLLRFERAGRAGAMLGAVIFMFNGCHIVWMAHAAKQAAMIWTPLVLLLAGIALKRRSAAAAVACAAAVGVQLTAGFLQFTSYSLFALVIYIIYQSFANSNYRDASFRRAAVCLAGAAFALGAAMAAVHLWPVMELAAQSDRPLVLPHNGWFPGVPIKSIVNFILPDYFGTPIDPARRAGLNYTETCFFVTIPALLLVLPAIFVALRRGGRRGQVSKTARKNEGGDSRRTPRRFARNMEQNSGISEHIADDVRSTHDDRLSDTKVCHSGLRPGIQGDRMSRSCGRASERAEVNRIAPAAGFYLLIWAFALAAMFGTPLYGIYYYLVPGAKSLVVSRIGYLFTFSTAALAGLGLGILVRAAAAKRRAFFGGSAAVAALALTLALILPWAMRYNTFCERRLVFTPTTVTEMILNSRTPGRIFSGDPDWMLFPDAATAMGLDDVRGYDSLYPVRYRRFLYEIQSHWGGTTSTRPPSIADLPTVNFATPFNWMNVKYILSARAFVFPGYEPKAFPGVIVYRNRQALPRAFISVGWNIVDNDERALALLMSPEFRPNHDTVLEHEPVFPPSQPQPANTAGRGQMAAPDASHQTARDASRLPAPEASRPSAAGGGRHAPQEPPSSSYGVVSRDPGDLALETHTESPCLLFVSEMFYPGWRAEINGEPVEVLRANYTFMAVPVPAGGGSLRLWFSPTSARAGLAVSLLAVFLALAYFSWLFLIREIREIRG